MINEEICNVCRQPFIVTALKAGKCSLCDIQYPNAKTAEDIKKKDPKTPHTMTEVSIREMVYEILDDAGIKRVPCEKCGKLFFKKSAASKFCENCKEIK